MDHSAQIITAITDSPSLSVFVCFRTLLLRWPEDSMRRQEVLAWE